MRNEWRPLSNAAAAEPRVHAGSDATQRMAMHQRIFMPSNQAFVVHIVITTIILVAPLFVCIVSFPYSVSCRLLALNGNTLLQSLACRPTLPLRSAITALHPTALRLRTLPLCCARISPSCNRLRLPPPPSPPPLHLLYQHHPRHPHHPHRPPRPCAGCCRTCTHSTRPMSAPTNSSAI